ncbi:unnamed protein product [Vicia faba]|uniref:Cytochrome P450 n=1 Tax=Vicia faba TaxID=3906 RepID=A0AAV0Z584_VICFA|nr:unnamed protein product [Vicia faba]
MTAFFLTLTSLFFLIITLKLLLHTTRFKNLPPGPPFLPIIGNLHQLKQPLHHTFQTLSQKHGQIFSLWDEIMRLIQKLARVSYHDFSEVELTPMFSELTFNTVMRMMSGKGYFGDDCDVSDVEEARLFREIMKEITSIGGATNVSDFLGFLRWFDFDGLEKSLKRISKRVYSFLQRLIDEHRFGKRNTNTMLDHLLKQQQSQLEYYTDQIIKGLIMVMLIAGTDTSSITLEWAMANLLNNPNILKKAKDEFDTHMGQDYFIDEHDISKLSYLQNIVYETLRLHPAAPLLLPHFSSEDFTIEKYNIPQNTILMVNAWAIHRDPNLWTDPICFKPERFEKEGEINKLLSFGMGRRACPGENLAHRTVKKKLTWAEKKGITMGKEISLKAMCKLRHPMMIKNSF